MPSIYNLCCHGNLTPVPLQFSQNNKLIVFISSCEAVEFLHSLLTRVLSANRKPPLDFMRLHGNMKQEVSAPRAASTVGTALRCLRVFVFPTRSAHRSSSSSQSVGVESCSVRSVSPPGATAPGQGLYGYRAAGIKVAFVFQDVAARGLDLPQVTWIVQVSPVNYGILGLTVLSELPAPLIC